MKNLKALRNRRGLSQKDFADIFHASQNTVSQWENGKREPNYEITQQIADFFGVTTDYLLGREVMPIHTKKGIKIPVLGRVQAGIPVEAIEEIVDYEEITEDLASQGEYFGLLIRGESMMPRMFDGDVIIVRKQPDIDSGDIAVVLVNGYDATVKKIRKTPNGIELVPLNPSFEIMYYSNEDIERLPVVILGKVIEVRGKL